MSLEERFKKYPALKEAFWPSANEIKHQIDHPHPLTSLILDSGSRTTQVAIRTDKCIQLVNRINQNWLKDKVKIILNYADFSNVSAALGEIRAFGELIWIKGEDVLAGKSGSDFNFKLNDVTVHIEVNTPQHRTKRHTMEHESFESDRIKGKTYEIFPFGWPERNIDNVQGETVSKIASVKQKEHQFQKDTINILWVDLKDPTLWQLDFGNEQFLPISAFREEITSGAFWNAFYAKKNTYIYEHLSVQGLASKIYKMEYNGRFWNESLVDFVIADTRTDQILFQNPNRDMNIPNELFRSMYCLFAFNLELSWLDWPVKGSLLKRVEIELERIQKYKDIFQIN
jgi:hypothetical protein